MDHVVEVVLFRLNDGVTEAQFLEAAQPTFDLLQSTDGYINRQLTINDEGLWVDVVNWANMEAAMKAAESIMQSDIGIAFGSLIDVESMQMHHLQPKLTDIVQRA